MALVHKKTPGGIGVHHWDGQNAVDIPDDLAALICAQSPEEFTFAEVAPAVPVKSELFSESPDDMPRSKS